MHSKSIQRLKNFEYGNYFDYSKRRNALGADDRLELLNPEWFGGKDVLDIGCNLGDITYHVAKNYKPRRVVGLDIDPKLIGIAKNNLYKHLDLKTGNYKFPISLYHKYGPLIDERPTKSNENNPPQFPDNIFFIAHDYVMETDEQVEDQQAYYDVILCLSVTKWIHLNYCDDGLKRAFRRMYKHLRPGGLLILEAQPFDNYKRRKKMSPILKENFEKIQFKPKEFESFLLGDVGFANLELSATTNHHVAGFRRPLQVFRKD